LKFLRFQVLPSSAAVCSPRLLPEPVGCLTVYEALSTDPVESVQSHQPLPSFVL
jgi:hypothetical protein